MVFKSHLWFLSTLENTFCHMRIYIQFMFYEMYTLWLRSACMTMRKLPLNQSMYILYLINLYIYIMVYLLSQITRKCQITTKKMKIRKGNICECSVQLHFQAFICKHLRQGNHSAHQTYGRDKLLCLLKHMTWILSFFSQSLVGDACFLSGRQPCPLLHQLFDPLPDRFIRFLAR